MLRGILLSLARQRQLYDAALTDRAGRERFAELSLVIAIVSILVTLAADGYADGIERVRIVEALSLLGTDRADAVAVRAATGRLPEAVVRGPNPRIPLGKYVEKAQWHDEELVLEIANRGAAAGATSSLGFRVAVEPVSGSSIWLCGRREPPPGFVAALPQHTTISSNRVPHFCRAETESP